MTQSFVRVTHLSEVDHKRPTYLAIGSFDGVHLGHQTLLRAMVARARQDGARAAALTFFPHPRRVMQTLPARFYLTTLDDRVQLLAEQGIDLIVTHPFNDEVRQIRAAVFVDQLLAALDMRQLWGGNNIALGYKREGDVPFLRQQGAEKGFTVETMTDLVEWDGAPASSRRVREALAAGDMATVNGCLGRRHSVRGPVVKGDQRGRTIGFPPDNLALWDELLLPGYGVYATYAAIHAGASPRRPTSACGRRSTAAV